MENINWYHIQQTHNPHNNVTSNKNSTVCSKFFINFVRLSLIHGYLKLSTVLNNQVCSEKCTSAGCWDFGPDQCLACSSFVINGTCLETCKSLEKYVI